MYFIADFSGRFDLEDGAVVGLPLSLYTRFVNVCLLVILRVSIDTKR